MNHLPRSRTPMRHIAAAVNVASAARWLIAAAFFLFFGVAAILEGGPPDRVTRGRDLFVDLARALYDLGGLPLMAGVPFAGMLVCVGMSWRVHTRRVTVTPRR